MAETVVRRDIIELGIKTDNGELDRLRKELEELKKSIKGGSDSLDKMGNSAAFSKIKQGFSSISKAASNFSSQIDRAASKITSKLFNLKTLISSFVVGSVAKTAISVVADRQDIISQFEVLLGSAKKASQRVDELTDFAGQTPYTRDEIFRASKQLQVFTGDTLSTGKSLKMVGDVAAGTGRSFEDVALWTGRLYSAMKSGQAVGEMVARFQEMGAISGTDREKIKDLAEEIKKGKTTIEKSWSTVTQIFSRFDGTMEKLSNNMNNMLLSLKSFVTNSIMLPIGEGITKGLQPAIVKFRRFRKENKASVDAMGQTLKNFGEKICVPLFSGIESAVEGAIKIFGSLKDGVQGLEKLKGQSPMMDRIVSVFQFVIEHKDTILVALEGIAKVCATILVVSKIQQLIKALSFFATPLGLVSMALFGLFTILKKNGITAQDIINGISKAIGWFKKNIKWLIPVLAGLAGTFLLFKGFSFVSKIFGAFGKSTGNSEGFGASLVNLFAGFAKTKISVVLKGLANLSIIISGLTLLSAVVIPILNEIAKATKFKFVVQAITLMGLLGLIGVPLTKFAAKLGDLSVKKVLKGLANLAIVISGLSVLYSLVGTFSLMQFDALDVLNLIEIITVLGTLGTVLAIFAGIAGKIDVKKVSLGLANISIIVSGLSALFLVVFSTSLIRFDTATIYSFLNVLTALGIVGAALSVLAGAIGFVPAKRVSLGLSNIAIIVTGMSSLYVLVGAVSLIKFDTKALYVMLGVISVLGLVGAALSVLAGLVGLIPIALVSKGLANIAIVVAGMSALYLLIGAVSLINFDTKELFKLIGILTVLTAAGSVLTIFAGIVGLIPMPLVLSGLGNIASVLVGMTALITAYGALGKIPGFNDFMSAGGDTLANIFAQIGKIAGSLVGGVGEGISDSFPKIGENIAGFVEKLKPAIEMFADKDLSGVKTFFDTLSSFMLKMAGEQLLSKITGGTSLGDLGTDLSLFMTNSGEFFDKIATIPESSFNSITNLFNALSAINGFPKSGGFYQFFTGDPYQGLKSLVETLPSIADTVVLFLKSIEGTTDFTPISSLFNALATIKELPSAGGFYQFFTGDPYKGLQTMIKMLPRLGWATADFMAFMGEIKGEKDFSVITSLFNALASVKELPSAGGFFQYFTGDPYKGLQTMVDILPNLGWSIADFMAFVGEIKGEKDFSVIPSLFNALASVEELPKKGGLFQWFSGDSLSSLGSLTANLAPLGEAAGAFYTSIAVIDDFGRINALFTALGSIDDNIGKKEGGFGEWIKNLFSSDDGSGSWLGQLGKGLKSFGENTKEFFAEVNNLNIGNLNGLWESLRNADGITADTLTKVEDHLNKIVEKTTKLPQRMGEGISSGGQYLADSLVSIWVEAAKAMAQPVNKVIEGANWILKEFGAEKQIAMWTPYAKGTDGHKGGNALVNDGRGAELVQMPNGNTYLPQGRNVFIPNAPKGMKVLPANQTAQLMCKSSPTFNYAKGTGNIDLFEYIGNASGLVDEIKKTVSYDGMSGYALHAGRAMVNTITEQMPTWIEKQFENFGALSLANYVASGGVEQWKSVVATALKMEGQYSEANLQRTLYQMQTESSGNPKAINLWDSNAKKGIPSKGLMQVIDPTFKTYARPGYNSDIYDPLSNILASIRYATSRYGSLAKAYQGHGYANGGVASKPSIFGENGSEMAIPLSKKKRKRGLNLWARAGQMLGVQLPYYSPENDSGNITNTTTNNETNTYNPVFNLTINGSTDSRSQARQIKQWINEALQEAFESMQRKAMV